METRKYYQEPRRVLSRQECINRGLYFGPNDRVNLDTFNRIHDVVLNDGRRFLSEKAALIGTTMNFVRPHLPSLDHPALTKETFQ